MYLVVRRGALGELERACQLAGAAAVQCVRRFSLHDRYAEAFALWDERPRKVVLRARATQWERLLGCDHVLAGCPEGEAVLALPPRQPARRDELLGAMQAMASDLGSLPDERDPPEDPVDAPLLSYVLNPALKMSSGKTLAQVAHAAVMAAKLPELDSWVRSGCPARARVAQRGRFTMLHAGSRTVARVIDAGLTEVPPGTVTVLARLTVARRA